TSIDDVDNGAIEGIAITALVSGTGTWQFSIDNGGNWSAIDSVSTGNALLLRAIDKVRFVPNGVAATVGSITYCAWDQSGATAGQHGSKVDASSTGGSTSFSVTTDTASLTVTAVDDPASVTTSGGTTAFIEGNNTASAPVVVDSGLTLADSDSATLASATLSISGNFQAGQDVLAFLNDGSTMGNIAASYNAGTGVLTFTSAGATATLAQWQAALRSVTYGNSSETPDTSTRTLSFVVNDGNSDSSTATKLLSVADVNDAPIVNAPGTLSVTEDSASALAGISFSDADVGGGTVTASFSVASGTLAASSGGGVTVSGSSTALTLSGTVADINAFISANNLSYTTAAHATTDVTLTVAINDGGNTGSGGAQSDSAITTLQVVAVNDAPTVTAPVSLAVTEDVSTALSGISFADVDAGSAAVTATFSVPSGTLTATSGSGVIVSGSGTGTLTLSGAIADINAFIAANSLSFTTAANATGNVLLSVSIDDDGNTGGGNLADSATVTLQVTAVNDAPVNAVPSAQNTNQDQVLIFSSGNGNLISISDVDAGSGTVRLTLTASNGLLSLSGITGLSFSAGSGSADSTMTFEGSLVDINAALNGLVFSPTPGYNGAASLQIVSNDLGLSGAGGVQTDSDTIAITVNSLNPAVTSVQVTDPNGAYKVGDIITVTVTFDQAVIVNIAGGAPTLLLETGTSDRQASYVAGSGSSTLIFSYTVQAGDVSADLDYQSSGALSLNGATIRSASSADALLNLPPTGGAGSIAGQHDIVVDGLAPSVTSVAVPANGTYVAGQNLDFTVNLSESVIVDTSGGSPRIAVSLDTGGTVYADYLSGSGTAALVFRLTVANGQLDSNGIGVGNTLELNGGSLRDAAGNAASTTLNGIGSTATVLVDAVVPTVASVSVPAIDQYGAGDVLSFTVNASEAVIIDTTGGTPRLALDIGGVTRYASYLSGSGSTSIVFQYTVQAGDADADGIGIGSGLQLNGGTVRDAAGNDLDLSLNGVGATDAIIVDTAAPTASTIVRSDANPTSADTIRYTVTFSESVTGVTTDDFALALGGSANASIASVTSVDGQTYIVEVNNISGTGSIGLDLNNSGTGIADGAGNPLTAGLSGALYSVDRNAPTIVSVTTPANGTYVAGQNLDFTVNLSETVIVDTNGGTPRIAVTLDSGGIVYADYISGSGSSALLFRLTVANGQLDSNGIGVGNTLELNGGSLRDALGNAAIGALNGIGDTSGVLVDAQAPAVVTVSLPADGAYANGDALIFTVNASEIVLVDTTGGSPRLAIDLGGNTVYADYLSGSGSNALVFRYIVQASDNDSNGIALAGALELNGASLSDTAGNAMALALAGIGATGGVIIDTTPPTADSLVLADPSPNSANSVRFTLTFNEAVFGVDIGDFTLRSSGGAVGTLQSVVQLDARTYLVVVGNVSGNGSLGLSLNATGTAISDAAGNNLTAGLVGDSYRIATSGRDPEFLATPPAAVVPPPLTPAPLVPPLTALPTTSPLLPLPLFEQPTLGSGIPTLGNIFINNRALAPSFIAQVFASSSAGSGRDGSGSGFLGFGGGDAGVFGSSTLSNIFGSESLPESEPLEVFDGKQWRGSGDAGQGLRGAFGAPTLGQQLHDIHQTEQRQIGDLAWALGQMAPTEPPA
ncbi:hypothetical protein HP532_11725, partial [Pseudomonas sp. CrR25]|nr:hypothetical protein [Pseudomonas sp. CrR25]